MTNKVEDFCCHRVRVIGRFEKVENGERHTYICYSCRKAFYEYYKGTNTGIVKANFKNVREFYHNLLFRNGNINM